MKMDRITALAACVFALPAGMADAAPKKGEKTVECFGVNSCKGQNACAVTQAQIDAANAHFKGKFPAEKSVPLECAGNTQCGASKGHLAWMSKSPEECNKMKGFTLAKGADGKFTVKEGK